MNFDKKTENQKITEGNLELVSSIPQRITVILGEAVLQTKDLTKLGEGSIIELDNLAGADVLVKANDTPIAMAEVITIDETFGIRITSILTKEQQSERMVKGSRRHLVDVKLKKGENK